MINNEQQQQTQNPPLPTNSQTPNESMAGQAEQLPTTTTAYTTAYIQSFQNAKNEVVATVNMNKKFKVHVAIAIAFVSVTYMWWFFVAWAVPGLFPFWMPTVAFFSYTLSAHYFLGLKTPRAGFALHKAWFTITHVLLFCIWLVSSHTFRTNWWLYSALFCAFPLAIHSIVREYPKGKRAFPIHFAGFSLLNALCFTIWFDTRGVPWPFYFFFITLIPIIIHTWFISNPKGQRDGFQLHVYIFVDFQLLFFFIWATTDSVPWFAVIFAIWFVGLLLHFARHNRKQKEAGGAPVLPVVNPEGGKIEDTPLPIHPVQQMQQQLQQAQQLQHQQHIQQQYQHQLQQFQQQQQLQQQQAQLQAQQQQLQQQQIQLQQHLQTSTTTQPTPSPTAPMYPDLQVQQNQPQNQ